MNVARLQLKQLHRTFICILYWSKTIKLYYMWRHVNHIFMTFPNENKRKTETNSKKNNTKFSIISSLFCCFLFYLKYSFVQYIVL